MFWNFHTNGMGFWCLLPLPALSPAGCWALYTPQSSCYSLTILISCRKGQEAVGSWSWKTTGVHTRMPTESHCPPKGGSGSAAWHTPDAHHQLQHTHHPLEHKSIPVGVREERWWNLLEPFVVTNDDQRASHKLSLAISICLKCLGWNGFLMPFLLWSWSFSLIREISSCSKCHLRLRRSSLASN